MARPFLSKVVTALGGERTPPVASMMEWAAATDPDVGWMLCDGRILNSVTQPQYALLFSRIGTIYGGTSASAFALPDFRGRGSVAPNNMGTAMGAAPLGVNRIQTLLTNRGTAIGEDDHVLGIPELPSHGHAAAGGTLLADGIGAHSHGGASGNNNQPLNHTHSIQRAGFGVDYNNIDHGPIWGLQVNSGTGLTNTQDADRALTHNHGIAPDGAHGHTISGATATTGSGQAHNVVHPSLVVPKIIRVF